MFEDGHEAREIEAQGGIFVMRRPLKQLNINAILVAWDQADTAM